MASHYINKGDLTWLYCSNCILSHIH